MKKAQVKIGTVYVANVGRSQTVVRIDAEHDRGGWHGVNLRTGEQVHIKSGASLKREAEPVLVELYTEITELIQRKVVEYRGHQIKPKLDFDNQPFVINGMAVDSGWVVIKHGANVMPAATWFTTIDEAVEAIDILIDLGGTLKPDMTRVGNLDTDEFWNRMRYRDRDAFHRRVLSTCTPKERQAATLHCDSYKLE